MDTTPKYEFFEESKMVCHCGLNFMSLGGMLVCPVCEGQAAKDMIAFRYSMKQLGFKEFQFEDCDHYSYENKPVAAGGIRIVTYKGVAEIWSSKKHFKDIVEINNCIEIVKQLLL